MQRSSILIDQALELARPLPGGAEVNIDLAIARLVDEVQPPGSHLHQSDYRHEIYRDIIDLIKPLSQENRLELILRSNTKQQFSLSPYNDLTNQLTSQIADYFKRICENYETLIFTFRDALLLAVEVAATNPEKKSY